MNGYKSSSRLHPHHTHTGRSLSGPLLSLSAPSILKRARRQQRPGRVAFDGITVYYFPRCQGFTSVPSRGGCTLGMASRHSACRLFSLAEFTQEQVRARREKLRQRLKEEKLEALRWKVWTWGASLHTACAGKQVCVGMGEACREASVAGTVAWAGRGFAWRLGGPGICHQHRISQASLCIPVFLELGWRKSPSATQQVGGQGCFQKKRQQLQIRQGLGRDA